MSKNDWVDDVTPKLKYEMENTAKAAYENANELREDALILFEKSRFSRATALSILAEEEYSKAFMIYLCAQNSRWDSAIFKALKKHSNKQSISEAMIMYINWFVDNYNNVMKINSVTFGHAQPEIYPDKKKLDEILNNAKSRIKKPVKDFLKQDSFYVGLSKECKATSLPKNVSEKEAKSSLKDSLTFKVITEILFGNNSNIELLNNI